MSDRDLMLKIRREWGDTIADVCKASSIPANFLAALVANESGGDAAVMRREPSAVCGMCEVLAGYRPAFQGMDRETILKCVSPPADRAETWAAGTVGSHVSSVADHLVYMGASWGLTQIMGWQEAKRAKPAKTIQDPRGNLLFALDILERFAEAYSLDLTQNFEAMLRCWNSGTPTGKTFDPNYVTNGLNRRTVYGLIG